jgi:hypothetical protein
LIDEAKAHKAELIEAPDVSHAIQAAIVGARSWPDLSRLCEQIDAAYRAGDIDLEKADELTNRVRERSREVPENEDAALLEMPLSQFAQSGICREIHSKVLDERVIFAADNAEVPEDTPLVVYRAAELRELLGATPEKIRAVHEVKRSFDGEVVDELEAGSGDQVLPSETMHAHASDTPPDTCPACHHARWWTDTLSGRRVCGVCHPPSRSAVEA